MVQAFLNGKLSGEQENMEDILTSIVFGTMKYLPPERALFPFFAQAQSETGGMPLAGLNAFSGVNVEYEFWSKLNTSEPDVLITISNSDKPVIILVEAKYNSGKSSIEDDSETPNDQLAREWSDLQQLAGDKNAEPYLIYLTKDFGFPYEEIRASRQELKRKNNADAEEIRTRMCWLSWRNFPLAADAQGDEMLNDVVKLLRDRLKMIYFDGINAPDHVAPIQWRFVTDTSVYKDTKDTFEWPDSSFTVNWAFNQN